MPTFTAIAIDRFLEPGASKSIAKTPPPNSKLDRNTSTEKKTHRAQISPSLYATPEATPLPDSPSSFPPSPYIVDHKRRGPRLLKRISQDDVSLHQQGTVEEKDDENCRNADKEVVNSTEGVSVTATVCEEVGENGFHDGELESSNLDDGLGETNTSSQMVAANLEVDCSCEDFFDPRESMSVTSNTDVEDNNGAERSLRMTTPMVEFFDAWEELSSEGGPQPSLPNVEDELREIRMSLLMEIERRKQAEEALNNVQRQWQRIGEQLSHVGLTFPADPTTVPEDEHLDYDPAEDICRQIHLARFVSNSVGRGCGKAEVQMEMEARIESKNFEITRLCDRLNFYETVNREMSQRNQEAIEMARHHRQRRKRRQRWVWSSIGAAITLGVAALAWSYIPTEKESSSTNASQGPEGDHAAKQ
ncbi:hypothetical protein HHK36_010157 [Tetracentron sinense]|uniref:Uncharacterized protein n=1 Tax=Tetracentron sinense TaxID=13715 RepID=A0A835DJ06_TETSI|nr:hypothetical protein HHK36_010157 [Tetracentron sinense]